MENRQRLILVIETDEISGDSMRELIEFMDAPLVRTATPLNWRKQLGTDRLSAVFVSRNVDDKQFGDLMRSVSEIDPNIPIVLFGGGGPDASQ